MPHAALPLSLFTQALATSDALERSLAVDALHAVRSRLPKTLHPVAATAASEAAAALAANATPSSLVVPRTPATVLLVGAPATFDLPGALEVGVLVARPAGRGPGALPASTLPPTRVPLRVLTQRFAALRDVVNAAAEASLEGRLLAAMKASVQPGDSEAGNADDYDVDARADDSEAEEGTSASGAAGRRLAALGYRYSYGYGRTLGRSMLSSLAFGAPGATHGSASGSSSGDSGRGAMAAGVAARSGGSGGGAAGVAAGAVLPPQLPSSAGAPFAIPPPARSPTAALGISPHMATYADIAAEPSLRQVAADVAAAAGTAASEAAAAGGAAGVTHSHSVAAPTAVAPLASGPKPISPPRVAVADFVQALASEVDAAAATGGSARAQPVPSWAQFSPAAAIATAVVFLPLNVAVPSVEGFIRPAIVAHQREAAAAGGVAALVAEAPTLPGYRPGAPLRLRGRLYDVVAGDTVAKRARTLFEPLAHVLRVLVGALVARPSFMAMLVLSRPFPDPDAFPVHSIFGPAGGEAAGSKRRREGGAEEGEGCLSMEDERAMLGTTAQDLWSATLSSVLRHTTAFYSAVGVPHAIQSLSVETVAASPATLAALSARGNDAQPAREYVVVCVTLARSNAAATAPPAGTT